MVFMHVNPFSLKFCAWEEMSRIAQGMDVLQNPGQQRRKRRKNVRKKVVANDDVDDDDVDATRCNAQRTSALFRESVQFCEFSHYTNCDFDGCCHLHLLLHYSVTRKNRQMSIKVAQK